MSLYPPESARASDRRTKVADHVCPHRRRRAQAVTATGAVWAPLGFDLEDSIAGASSLPLGHLYGRSMNGLASSVPAVRVEGVVKRFGTTVALDGAGLEVSGGMVFGLLGRTERARPRWSAFWPNLRTIAA